MLPAKRRTAEKRREISRCAARHRREKEADVFTDLYVTVPIVEEPKVTHVDRIAVLRLAASLCRFRQVADKVLNGKVDTKSDAGLLPELFGETVLGESLNGFLLVVDSRSSIIYISPNVSRSLGLTQTDLIGHFFHDFLHQDDLAELKDTFSKTEVGSVETLVVRMKSVLGARGRNLNLRSALYKAISFGLVKHQVDNVGNGAIARNALKEFPQQATAADGNDSSAMADDDDDDSSSPSPDIMGLDSNHYYFLYGSLINQYGNLDSHSAGAFVTRHSMDMKFSYCHDRLSDYLGYDIKSLMGISFYTLVHPDDLQQLSKELRELYKKGQVGTSMYRLMAKSGGCIWLTSEISVVTQGTRSGRGQHIVCVHQVVSGAESGEILADVQQNMPLSVSAYPKSSGEIGVKKHVPPTTVVTKANEMTSVASNLSERAPIVTNSGGATIPVLAYAGNYDRWLFRGCRSTTDAEYAPPLVPVDECRSALHSTYSSSGSRGDDVDSADDRSPPLLIGVGNDFASAYYSEYNAFEFGERNGYGNNAGSELSSERAPMLVPADCLGANGTQPGQNGNMYPTLLDADFPSTKELSDKLDDLTLLAPFVDTGELVHLDLLDGDLEVPLDFGDFNDISLDFFTQDNRAKPLSMGTSSFEQGKIITKEEYDPTVSSCHTDLRNFSPKSLADVQQMNTQRGKVPEWPQIIENISPMTSGRTETVHQSYHVTIERANNANWLNNSNGFAHQQYDKTSCTTPYKQEPSNYCCKKLNENFNTTNDNPYKVANKLGHHHPPNQHPNLAHQESFLNYNQHSNFLGQHQTYGHVVSKPAKHLPEYNGSNCCSKLPNYGMGGLGLKTTTPLQHLSTMVMPPNYHTYQHQSIAPPGDNLNKGHSNFTQAPIGGKKSKRQHQSRRNKSSLDSAGKNCQDDQSIGIKRRLPCGESSAKQSHATAHVGGLNLYHNPSLEVAVPPPLYGTANSATWQHQHQLQQRPLAVYYNAPLLVNDHVIAGEPKVKRYKMSNLPGYIKVENIF